MNASTDMLISGPAIGRSAVNGLVLDGLRRGVFARAVSLLTLSLFTFVFYLSPTGKAVADELSKDDKRRAKIEQLLEATPGKKLAHRLQKFQQRVTRQLPAAMAQRQADQGWLGKGLKAIGLGDGPLEGEELLALQDLRSDIVSAYDEVIGEFEREGMELSAAAGGEVAQVIQQRHGAALQQLKARYGELQNKLDSVILADEADVQQSAFDQLNDFLGQQKFKTRHTSEDPNNLPWGRASDKVREPKLNRADLQAALGINPLAQYSQLASNQLSSASLAGVFAVTMAAANSPVSEAELAPSLEVQLTDEILQLAQSLNNNPTEIYAWVHNNIRFIPSYGSIQGAQHTLDTRRGNAMDTASLLIALLRAANIPARYVYGTVDISPERVMNWVGGADTRQAAQAVLSQGGIPNIAGIIGGVANHIRLEHTWVEAYVDFEPSRGVNNREGDHWIPMDAAFKQYDFSEGMALQDNVPFDAQSLVDSIEQNASVNEAEGWVQNVPQGDIESQLQAFQSQIEDYISNQNPEATVGDVLGLQEIRIIPPRPLSAGLPYKHIATQQTFAEVPDSLRHKFTYSLAVANNGSAGPSFIQLNQPTVALAGKKLAVSFKPASADDEAIIASYLPEPDPNTGEVDPALLPDTLPGYLINLTGELTIEGEVIASGAAQTMGSELYETLGLYSPAHGWHTSVNHPISGEYRAIGLDLQGISPKQAEALQQSVETTKAKLESQDEAQLATLTKHDVIGDLIYGTIMSYFALNDVQDEIQAQASNILNYRLPSYGIFSTKLAPLYWFGIPRDVEFSGLSMDVDLMFYQTVDKSNDRENSISFLQASGSRASAMEHLVPEQMFSTPEAPAQGISAVKALALASQEGQKIWTITQNNLDLALSSIELGSEVETEIRNAVNAGKTATAHEAKIVYGGWIGSGYLLIDPETGAGAYKIAGGGNGSNTVIDDVLSTLMTILGVGAGIFDILFQDGPFAALGRIISWLSGGLTVFGAFEKCTGSDIFVVLVPLFLVVVWMFILGPLGFGLVAPLRLMLTTLGGLMSAKGTNSLMDARCN